MTGYTKLFNSILGSTIWREDPATKVVWITLLALADRDGTVESSVSSAREHQRPPHQLHLKESRDIEAAAHVCLLLYQPTDTQTGEFTGEDEIIIGKQRNGPLGWEPVTFSKHSLQFVEREGR